MFIWVRLTGGGKVVVGVAVVMVKRLRTRVTLQADAG